MVIALIEVKSTVDSGPESVNLWPVAHSVNNPEAKSPDLTFGAARSSIELLPHKLAWILDKPLCICMMS